MEMADAWFPDVVAIAAPSTTSSTGKPTYAAAVEGIPARIEYRTTLVNTPEGQDLVSETVVVVKAQEIVAKSRIWLAGASVADPNLAKLALAVDTQRDRAGRLVISRAWL